MSEAKIIYEPTPTGHWKELFPQKNLVLGSHNLNPGEEIVAIIDHIEITTIRDPSAGKENNYESEIRLMHFEGDVQPMALNIGNSRIIAGLYGDYHAAWKGKAIQIFVGEVKQVGGGMGPGLCVRPFKPDIGENVDTYINVLRNCKTMEQLASAFQGIPIHLKARGSSTGQLLEAVKDEMKDKVEA